MNEDVPRHRGAQRSCAVTRKRIALLIALFLFAPFSTATGLAAESVTDRGVKAVPASTVGIYRNSWAVIIGINGYRKAPKLNYAVSDAKNVLGSLRELGFPPENTIAILDQEATKQRIEQVLYGALRKTTPEDRVLVFFAGHGITVSLPRGGDEGYLLPIDGDPHDPALTAIAMEDLRRIARRIPAKHILFAVDACYSGFAITRDIPPARVDSVYLEAMTKEPAVQIITAGRKGEPVLEEDGHGLFTRRFLQGLRGLADVDQNGVITGQELATWLESRVIRDSQNRQHPQYSRLDGEGQFVFVVPRGEPQPSSPAQPALEAQLKRLTEEVERLKKERALDDQRRLEAERASLLAEKKRRDDEREAQKRSDSTPPAAQATQQETGLNIPIIQAPAIETKLREHIKIARSHRDQGNYSAALAELEKARALAPGDKDIQLQIDITRKACTAEKKLGRMDLAC